MGFISTANERRPKTFEELKGQDYIVKVISNSIESKRFAHAYLFAGPRGVGKTTSARLLAKSLNCEKGPTIHPCGVCPSCVSIASSSSVDCIEIDGASNTSVDDIRKIKNDIMFNPSSRFKIYIIDEVHMLSTSAFNALLKTIEEPPEYVIFIFATTEIQKVPQTIKSRCQFFKFRAFESSDIINLIEKTCKDNKIKIDKQSLLWLAKESTGSMRDAYTLYDQLVSFCGNEISFEKIKDELLLTSTDSIKKILLYAISSNAKGAIETYFELVKTGISPQQFIEDFTSFIRALLLYRCSLKAESVLLYPEKMLSCEEFNVLNLDKIELILSDLLTLYRDIRYSVNPEFEIELFIARLCDIKNRASNILISKHLKELRNEMLDFMKNENLKEEKIEPQSALDINKILDEAESGIKKHADIKKSNAEKAFDDVFKDV